jgi:hypothetical protein
MLRNFQAHRKIKGPAELQRLGQVAGQKPVGRDPQSRAVDVVPVNTPHVFNAVPQKLGCPGPYAATHIDHAPYRQE